MELIKSNTHIDTVLTKYEDQLGRQLNTYRNHVYRILNLISWLHNSPMEEAAHEKFAIAAVFHDIGIWTSNTFDYLEPSAELAAHYLIAIQKENWVDEVNSMIMWHHKMFAYEGDHALHVNLFRKADWIDVSYGMIRFRLVGSRIKQLYRELPTLGFHSFLVKKGFSYGIRHPFRPLPMFRK